MEIKGVFGKNLIGDDGNIVTNAKIIRDDKMKILLAPPTPWERSNEYDIHEFEQKYTRARKKHLGKLQWLMNDPKHPSFKMIRQGEFLVSQVKELMALPNSYNPDAPASSKLSTMKVVCKLQDGITYPTNIVIDPYHRAPVLGDFEDSSLNIEEESSEEMPRLPGVSRAQRKEFILKRSIKKAGHANQVSSDILETWRPEDEGRTIISMVEYGFLRTRFVDLELLKIPITDINDEYLTLLLETMLTHTIHTEPDSRDLLLTHSLC